ncbi:FAD-dependent oxidoreductase [Jannaschia sp. S6380]|nr:FAD-dependent oxidoreductase [Jannaschia sp. S6380]
MAAAHALSGDHHVTLIEAEPRLGGHARTVLAGRRGDQPVDTGFIVFNKVNYPNLLRLFEDLDVPIADSDMSFAASLGGGRVEYSLQTADTMFAQRRNLLSPRFLRMTRDIFRFNARAADAANDPDLPLGAFLDRLGMGQTFRDWYIGPISGAIWSTPSQNVMDFPAQAMVRFFRNHALLSHTGQHDWFTVRGGSVEYVRRLQAHLGRQSVVLRTGTPVAGIRRVPGGAEVRMTGGEWEAFDDVVLATHSDDSLALLSDATEEETALLSRVRYQSNEAVLHADESVMPRRRKVWASWNYAEQADRPDRIGLTYWMNRLQPIPAEDPIFSTLNPQHPIREALIYDRTTFRHPVYDLAMLDAVGRLRERNGTANTWFCGAWMRNGFHEDGFVSALDVAEGMAGRAHLAVAAE